MVRGGKFENLLGGNCFSWIILGRLYFRLRIAGFLSASRSVLWLEAKQKLINTERINVNGNNEIKILNWRKYQSEYARQKPYRKRLQSKVTSRSATQSDQEKREERKNLLVRN